MVYVVIGGTFDGLHRGHVEFMRKAFSLGGKVLVCITSDSMAGKKLRSGSMESFDARKKKVEEFLSAEGFISRAEIFKLEDPFTPGLRPELTHIVVSHETRPNADRLNAMRRKRGLPELDVVEMEWVKAEDGHPISDARIRKGEIDSEGRKL